MNSTARCINESISDAIVSTKRPVDVRLRARDFLARDERADSLHVMVRDLSAALLAADRKIQEVREYCEIVRTAADFGYDVGALNGWEEATVRIGNLVDE